MISTAIQQLVNYGLDTGLILPDDEIYIRNQLLMTMQLDSFTEPEGDVCYADLESILKTLVDDAVARGVCDDSPTARDLFDTRLMGVLTPRPQHRPRQLRRAVRDRRPPGRHRLVLQVQPGHRLHPPLPHQAGRQVGHQDPLRRPRHHHQPVEARKRPQSHRSRKAGSSERLPQVPALRGERGLCRPAEPSRPGESPASSR